MPGPTTVVCCDLKLRTHTVCLGVTGEHRGGKSSAWEVGGDMAHTMTV